MTATAKQINNSKSMHSSVLVEPWVTEKAHSLMALNKYVFRISKGTNKHAVAAAVAHAYKVTVESVRIIALPRKRRAIGRTIGWKSGVRKAIVTLKEGDKIELFQGV